MQRWVTEGYQVVTLFLIRVFLVNTRAKNFTGTIPLPWPSWWMSLHCKVGPKFLEKGLQELVQSPKYSGNMPHLKTLGKTNYIQRSLSSKRLPKKFTISQWLYFFLYLLKSGWGRCLLSDPGSLSVSLLKALGARQLETACLWVGDSNSNKTKTSRPAPTIKHYRDMEM